MSTRARKTRRETRQQEEEVSATGVFWGCSSGCITAACSAFLAALEAIGTGRQDNPEYFSFARLLYPREMQRVGASVGQHFLYLSLFSTSLRKNRDEKIKERCS